MRFVSRLDIIYWQPIKISRATSWNSQNSAFHHQPFKRFAFPFSEKFSQKRDSIKKRDPAKMLHNLKNQLGQKTFLLSVKYSISKVTDFSFSYISTSANSVTISITNSCSRYLNFNKTSRKQIPFPIVKNRSTIALTFLTLDSFGA